MEQSVPQTAFSASMMCDVCGSKMASQVENFQDHAIGLDNVTLENVMVHRCPTCGGYGYDIVRMGPLHRTIARALIEKSARLLPKEIRYLRKYMDLGSAECAEQLGVDPATMSRYESVDSPLNMSRQTERLFRLMILLHPERVELGREELHLERLAIEEPKAQRLILRPHRQGWEYRWETPPNAQAA